MNRDVGSRYQNTKMPNSSLEWARVVSDALIRNIDSISGNGFVYDNWMTEEDHALFLDNVTARALAAGYRIRVVNHELLSVTPIDYMSKNDETNRSY
jgi:hypothetical protein